MLAIHSLSELPCSQVLLGVTLRKSAKRQDTSTHCVAVSSFQIHGTFPAMNYFLHLFDDICDNSTELKSDLT